MPEPTGNEQGNEQGNGQENGQGNDQQQTPPPAAGQENQGQPNGQGQENQGEDSPWADPAKARAEIERLRRENGDARINAKRTAAEEARQELLSTLTKALDPNAAEGEKVTPEQLTAQLTATGEELTSTAKDRAVALEAWKQGLNPAKYDYLAFQLSKNAEYQALDTKAADFGTKIASVISSEVAKDSTLKLSGAGVASGVEQLGGANGASTMTQAEFAKLPYSERVKLYNTNRAEYDRLNS